MEAGSRLGRVRILESECRRQQLEAYLARKGKLKIPGPNTRYYLEDKTNRKIQPPTAPSKVGLGGDLNGGGPTKPPKLKGTNNPASTNHVKSVAARSRAQRNTKTTEAKKTLSKTVSAVSTVPQTRTADIQIKKAPTLFPMESNTTESESLASQTAQSGQYEGDLKPVSGTSARADNLLRKSGDEEKESKYTTLNAGHSVSTALIKQFTEQTIQTQVGRSKYTGSDNRLCAIGIGRTAKAATRAAKPAGTAKAASSAAQPAGTAKAASSAAQPAGTAKAATRAAQPAGTAKAASRAAQPAGTAKAASSAAQPAGTAKAASRAAQPAGTAKAASRAAKPAGRVMVPKQSTMDKNYGYRRLSKSTQQLASDKTKPSAGAELSPQSASTRNGTNPTGKGPIEIWKPFTRPDHTSMHPDLGSPARNIKESKVAVRSASKSTASAMSTAKRWRNQSSVTKTLKGKDERRKQLEDWLTSKGKTYKRPPMPTPLKKAVKSVKKNLELSFWEAIEEEEQKSQADRANHMLDNCMKLLEEGLPPEQVSAALQKVPEGDKIAKYWICQARLLELTGTTKAIIAMFEQAVHSGAKPVEELRSALVEIIVRNANSQTTSAEKEDNETEDFRESAAATPHTTAMRILCGKAGGRGSSVVKYRVTKTPQVHRGKETLGRTRSVGQQGLKFLTPVRRSVRIEHVSASYPEMLREHDCCVTSLNELLAVEEAGTFVYNENQALLGE